MEQRLQFRAIDTEIVQEFKTAVVRKFGKLHGCMGPAAEEALKIWVAIQQRPHDMHKPAASARVAVKLEHLAKEIHWFSGDVITKEHLLDELAAAGLNDPRIIRKYVQLLEQYDVVKRRPNDLFYVNNVHNEKIAVQRQLKQG